MLFNDVIVGEVTYQTAGKCGHIVHNRTFVLTDDFTDGIAWMGNLSNLFCTAFCTAFCSISASTKSFRLTGFSNSQDSVCTGVMTDDLEKSYKQACEKLEK